MLVGVPREIKDNEYRVGIVPSTVRELADKGHQVVIETHDVGSRRPNGTAGRRPLPRKTEWRSVMLMGPD
jgi:hypothetical protein